MLRTPYWILPALLLTCLAPGCTGLFAERAIEGFAAGLQAQDLDQLKQASSSDFKERALRQQDAAKGLKLLRIPTGEIKVVSVEDLGNDQQKVLVKVGEKDKAREVEYRLAHNRETGQWVVNDIIMHQDSGGGEIVSRSVAEQMDLLLTVREIVNSWQKGSRDEQLAFCNADLRHELESLPPSWLQCLWQEVAGTGHVDTFRPEARFKDETAYVLINHTDGNLVIEMKVVENHWKVHDLMIEPKSTEVVAISSLLKSARMLNQGAMFLKAYAAEDREALGRLATKDFYSSSLAAADLTKVPLPVPELLTQKYEMRRFRDHNELLLGGPEQVYMLTIFEDDATLPTQSRRDAQTHISEVTLFDKSIDEVKRVSSVFLAHDTVDAYMETLRNRDIARLRQLSTVDFNNRVWDRPEAEYFAIMPESEIPEGPMHVVCTTFQGETSEVTIALQETPFTVVLQSVEGRLLVNDVLRPAVDRPVSMKTNLELLLSVQGFAAAAQRGDLPQLISHSAEGLDRMVWRQLKTAPPLIQQLVPPLMSETVAIDAGPQWATVTTESVDQRTQIRLSKEGSLFVIHDVRFEDKANPESHAELLKTMRNLLATRQIGPGSNWSPDVLPASHQTAERPVNAGRIPEAAEDLPADGPRPQTTLRPIHPEDAPLQPIPRQAKGQEVFSPIEPDIYHQPADAE